MMGRVAAVVLLGMMLSLGATAAARGSFSVKIAAPPFLVEGVLEQEVTRVGSWTVYAGSGFAVGFGGIDRLQPYVIACSELDVFVAFAELCVEGKAPIVGGGSIGAVYLNVVW